MRKGTMQFHYDSEADVLYIDIAKGAQSLCLDAGQDVFIGVDPKSERVLGFIIMDFSEQSANLDSLVLPFVEDYEIAERLRTYLKEYASIMHQRDSFRVNWTPEIAFTQAMREEIMK